MFVRVAFFVVLLAAAYAVHAERFALLVGNSTAAGNFATLKYVRNDLSSVQSILTDFCGFSTQHVTILYDQSPSELEKALADACSRLAPGGNNLFLFYYSGHADANALKMGKADFSLAKLKNILSSVPADIRIGVFDACQSASFTRIKGGTLSEPFLFRDDGKTKGQVILCASSINENAQESDAYGNSVFTFHFVNALRGSADMVGDGRITLNEAYQYAYSHTVSSTAGTAGGVQHPSYQFRIQGEGDIVLADLNIRTRGILLSSDVEGDVTIVNEKGQMMADLAKKAHSATMIAVLPGAYRIINSRGDQRFEAPVVVADQSVATVGMGDFRRVRASQTNAKGEGPEEKTQVGLTLSGAVGMYDLSGLSSGLAQRFADFAGFSINPSFSYRKYQVVPFFEGEVIVRGCYEAHMGFGGFEIASAGDYSGRKFNPLDNSTYGCRLHIEQTLTVKILDLGAGYRFQNKYIRNSSIHVGLSLYQPELRVAATFDDSLYDAHTAGCETRQAWTAVPYVALGYTWPVFDFLDIGAKIRYRWQHRPVQFNNDYQGSLPQSAVAAQSPLSTTFGGVDGGAFINIHLSFSRQQERP